MPLSFIHAADFHLGADLRRFGPARKKLEDAQFHALEKTLQWAVKDDADFVLICGDLFDSRNPPPGILGRTGEIFSAFPQTQIFILPGTHDFLGESSVLAQESIGWTGDNIVLLNNSAASPYQIAGSDVHLYFKPNLSNRSVTSPISGLVRQKKYGFHIGLAHGSLKIGALDFANDFPIDPIEIEKSSLDYLALGHWHKSRIEKYGSTTAAYCGIGQPIAYSDPEKGSVFFVKIEDSGKPNTTEGVVSSVTLKKVEETIYHPLEVARLLENLADPNTIVKLDLHYSDSFKEVREVTEIIDQNSKRFLLVHSDDNRVTNSQVSFGGGENANKQLIQAFRTELKHLREADSEERANLYEKAAELGIDLINGEE
jgi:DNA repair exonuclease SbcCD nuclease subunit